MVTRPALFRVLSFCWLLAAVYGRQPDYCTVRATYKDAVSGVQVVVSGDLITFSGGTGLPANSWNISHSSLLPISAGAVTEPEKGTFCFDEAGYKLLLVVSSDRSKLTINKPAVTCKRAATSGTLFSGTLVAGTAEFCAMALVSVFIAATGSLCSTLGMNLQKLTHDRLQKAGNHNANYATQPLWALGLFLIVFDAAVLDLFTFGMAPASLLAPLASLVLVWNIFLAPLMLGEKLDREGLKATAIIICGTAMSSATASHETPVYVPEFFASRFESIEVIIYLAAVVTVLGSTMFMISRVIAKHTVLARCMKTPLLPGTPLASLDDVKVDVTKGTPRNTWANFDTVTSLDSSLGNVAAVVPKEVIGAEEEEPEMYEKLDLSPGSYEFHFVRFGCGFLAGMLGGQSVLFAKVVIELLKTSIVGASQGTTYMCFTDWRFYIYLAGLVFILVTQMRILNLGLKYFDSLVIIPLMITFYSIFGILGGGLYYREFDGFQAWQWVLFPVGILISFFGIYCLATRTMPAADEDQTELAKDAAVDLAESRRRTFRLSVNIPLMNADATASPQVREARRSVASSLRRSMTADDIDLLAEQLGSPEKAGRNTSSQSVA